MSKTLWMSIGARMKSARQQRGLKQADIGAALDVSRAAVSQFETGTAQPSLSTLIDFATATSTSLDWLVFGTAGAGHYDQRIAALPEALKMYVVESLILAERVRQALPVQFLTPPTSDNYVKFSEYLTQLSKQPAVKTTADE